MRRQAEGRPLFDLAGALLVVAAAGLMLGDATGVNPLRASGLLGIPLALYYGTLATGFRGWPQEIVETDPFRGRPPSAVARVLAWPAATPARVRLLAAVLTLVAAGWAVAGVSAVT